MVRRVVITGATGTIGARLLDELAPDHRSGEIELWAMARSATSERSFTDRGFRCAHFDFASPATFHTATDGTHTLFLLRPYGMEAFIQSKRLIDAARDAGVAHVVHVSAYGAPWAATIGWIHLLDAYIAQSGMSYTHLRPGFFMDNLPAVTNPATRTLTHFFGTGAVAWIAALDIARAAAAAIRRPGEHSGRIYPLASEATSMGELATLIGEITGAPYRYVPAAADERAVAAFVARGRGEYFSRIFVEYMRAIAAGEVPEAAHTFDNVPGLTGRPATTWRDFIRERAATFLPPPG